MGGKSPKSPAKISPPRTANVFLRKRLFRLIDNGRKRQVIWVAGPAGAGKTTLVTSYLKERKLPCVWYQIDEGDSDPATFFLYMALAAGKAAPRTKPLPLLTREYLGGIPIFTKRFFETFFSKLKRPCLIVFDNYQEVPQESEFHQIITNGLSQIPDNITVVLISRSSPPTSMARLIANESIEIIGWDDLRLIKDETEKIACLNGNRSLTEEEISRLHLKAQGWMAGLVLMLKKLDAGSKFLEYPDGHVPQKIFDYFAGEIFSRMDKATQSFLLKTALLPRVTPSMARKLTGDIHAESILSQLSRENYFTETHYRPELSYQYHSLFREFLLDFAQNSLDRREVMRVEAEAARLLEEAEMFDDAARLYAASDDWDALSRLIERQAPQMCGEGRAVTVEAWIGQVPRHVFDSRPWLSYWLGMARLPYDFHQSRGYFEAAFETFRFAGDTTGMYESWCGIVDTFIYEWGDFCPLDRWIAEFEKVLRIYPVPSGETEIRVTACMLMALAHRQPEKRRFAYWEEKGRSLLKTEKMDINLRIMLMVPLLILYLWMGDPSRIALLLNDLKEEIASRSNPFQRLFWLTFQSLYCWMTNRPEEGLKSVAEGLKIAETTGISYWNSFLYNQGANAGLAFGNPEIFDHYMGKIAAQISSTRRLDICHYNINRALGHLTRGEYSTALEHARFATELSIECGAPWPIAFNRMVLAEVLFRCGDSRQAFMHLALAHNTGLKMGSSFLEYNWLLARSFFAFQEGKEAEGLKYLKKFMKLGSDKKYVYIDLGRSATMAFLCTRALEAGIEVDYVHELIKRRSFVPDPNNVPAENWPFPLKLYTLGRFEILRDGSKLSFSGKVQQKPLLILKALIARGGRGVAIDRLVDDIWPDSQGDLARQSFDTALHRLRRLVGEETLLVGDGLLTLDEQRCWLDVWAFDRLFGLAVAAIEKGEKRNTESEVRRLTKKVIDLYKGHFLPAETSHLWPISTRERLRSKFLRLVIKVGEYFEEAGRWSSAIEFFQAGLETDDLAEEFYIHLMNCYKQIGMKSEAIAIYRRCRSVISSVLGVNPSSKIERIYQSLMNNPS